MDKSIGKGLILDPGVLFVCFGCMSAHLYNNLNGLSADRGHGMSSDQISALQNRHVCPLRHMVHVCVHMLMVSHSHPQTHFSSGCPICVRTAECEDTLESQLIYSRERQQKTEGKNIGFVCVFFFSE